MLKNKSLVADVMSSVKTILNNRKCHCCSRISIVHEEIKTLLFANLFSFDKNMLSTFWFNYNIESKSTFFDWNNSKKKYKCCLVKHNCTYIINWYHPCTIIYPLHRSRFLSFILHHQFTYVVFHTPHFVISFLSWVTIIFLVQLMK